MSLSARAYTYNNLEFHFFPRRTPGLPAFREREMGGKEIGRLGRRSRKRRLVEGKGKGR